MKMKKGLLFGLMTAALLAVSAGCTTAGAPAAEGTTGKAVKNETAIHLESADPSPDWVGKLDAAKDTDQLFVVAGIGETTAYVSMHQKDADGNWKEILTTPGYIGKYGLGKTREGDAKTPVGTYHFNYAFGIAEDPGCALPYQKVTDDNYWSGDQREGYHYNEMVNIKDLPDLNTEDSEHIVDYVNQYQYCLNISYNEDGTPGKGSAIFLHCLGPIKPYTGGCVAIPKDKMITAVQNVKEDCVVVIDSLENIAPDLYKEFDLGPQTNDDSTNIDIDYGTSEIYSKEDMDAAIDLIMNEFNGWKGCEMHSIRYASDNFNSKENIKWVKELGEGKEYTECIQFLTDFHSPTDAKDLAQTAWEPDQEYKDYQWILARTEGGNWELLNWGY